MDIYCPVCREPWEMDTLHDEVQVRFPDKPWKTEIKPEVSHAPDTITDHCDVIIGKHEDGLDKRCYEYSKNHANNALGHEFVPQVFKNYKSYNYHPFFDKNDGMWTDERIYSKYYEEVSADFRKRGCAALNVSHNKNTMGDSSVISAVYDVMGDDLDGAASMFEDAESMGLME